jgi:hypothetical protein
MKAIAYRYSSPVVFEEDSLEEAVELLEGCADAGQHYQLGVYDTDSNVVHVPPYEWRNREDELSSIREALGLPSGHVFAEVREYEVPERYA